MSERVRRGEGVSRGGAEHPPVLATRTAKRVGLGGRQPPQPKLERVGVQRQQEGQEQMAMATGHTSPPRGVSTGEMYVWGRCSAARERLVATSTEQKQIAMLTPICQTALKRKSISRHLSMAKPRRTPKLVRIKTNRVCTQVCMCFCMRWTACVSLLFDNSNL